MEHQEIRELKIEEAGGQNSVDIDARNVGIGAVCNGNVDLTQHGFQDATITVTAPHADTVVMTNLTLTDTNVDTLHFIDGTFTNDTATATGSFTADATADEVARLYHATLARDPDFSGQAFWQGQLASGMMTQQQIAESFVTSPEFVVTYGSLSNADFVSKLYCNVLGRAPDLAGASFWTGVLNNGGLDRGGVVLGFSNSAEFQSELATKGLVGPTGIQFLANVDHA